MENNYTGLIESSPIGYAYHRMIYDLNGIPCDYEFIEVNAAFEKFTGLNRSHIVGRRVCEIIPDIRNSRFDWIKAYGELSIHGGSIEFEQFSEGLNRWYKVNANSSHKGFFVTWFTDITRQKEIEGELKVKNVTLEQFFEINLDLLCIADLQGNFIKVNKAWEEILGYPASELEKKRFLDFVHPDDLKDTLNALSQLGNNERVLYFVNRYKRRDGTYRFIEWCSQPDGNLIYAAARDITAHKETLEALRISEERLNIAMKGTRAGLWDWDMEQNTVVYSPTWKTMLGYQTHEIPDDINGWKSLWHPDEVQRNEQAIEDYLSGKNETYEVSHQLRCKNGQWRWIMTRGEVKRDSQGKPVRWVGTNIDLTHMKEAEDKIVYLSFHDQLTGLYNRRFFEEEMNRLDHGRNLPLSIIMADVNGLKLANDAFGHTIGDELLRKATDTMKNACRAGELVSRIGGDEFVIILPKTGLKEAEAVISRIRQSMVEVKAGMLDLSISFGSATKTTSSQQIEDVIKKAEENMYKVKLHDSPVMRRKTITRVLAELFERLPEEKQQSELVGRLCASIGKLLGLDDKELDILRKAGIMHDIGEITINGDIFTKPDSLTETEWVEVKRHPITSYQILNSVNELALVAKCVLHHHERWDGSGYPDGLKAGKIPLHSRIVAVADAIQAMQNDRPYRKVLSMDETMKELRDNAGTQFDPDIANIVLKNPSVMSSVL